ncbi:TPA: acyl carrier protein [Campylobacter lari]|uniref:acyl carrier protein n=1 Tax=Campylobacter lari TaxID=201 RepID=UPI0011EB6C44|nr:acyl carrier protein [Campylobacter lari]EAI4828558.1 acyl carrier protein [Campylobacter lari]EAI7268983.1 acyl carrier protein [Campylobacter lari]EAK5748246.1 acyl carrier protein [Campylobacter lari]KAB0589817.1 acyl carrier protein [Campylobacter lari subsp. concheus]MCV3368150.1 acyl carrier protein [Campylobacter lari]
MTKRQFLEKLEELLQIDYSLEENMILEKIQEYDSLALLSIVTLFDTEFNIFIQGKTLKECKTVKDIIELIPIEKLDFQ